MRDRQGQRQIKYEQNKKGQRQRQTEIELKRQTVRDKKREEQKTHKDSGEKEKGSC